MRRVRPSGLLTAAVLGTYVAVAFGATTAATGGPPAVAGAHYVAAAAVWGLLVVAAVGVFRGDAPSKVRLGTGVAVAAVPIQGLLGMAHAVGTAPPNVGALVDQLHLLGGVAVFGLLLLTLVWQLEHESGPPTESAPADPTGEAVTSSPLSERSPTFRDRVRAYVTLTKPRLMWLLCLLALAGMALAVATGASIDGVTVVATLAGGVLAVGASGTFNHVYERDRDRRMKRTAERPVATHRVGPRRATAFGLSLVVASMVVLVVLVNVLAAALTAAAVVYYSVVYTVVLKPTTAWNTVIGGGSGALPAVIGWAAVTNGVGLPALLLAALVVCWTPAHFYNLAIVYHDDYARASYPMVPVERGIAATRRRIVFWFGATLAVAIYLGTTVEFGAIYAAIAALTGAVFLLSIVQQYRLDTPSATYRSFVASNAYLGGVLVAILVEAVLV